MFSPGFTFFDWKFLKWDDLPPFQFHPPFLLFDQTYPSPFWCTTFMNRAVFTWKADTFDLLTNAYFWRNLHTKIFFSCLYYSSATSNMSILQAKLKLNIFYWSTYNPFCSQKVHVIKFNFFVEQIPQPAIFN